jgi:hypothetical protein
LKSDPFNEFGGIVNSVRDAVDAGTIIFYDDSNHPSTLQQVDLRLGQRSREDPGALERFLESKVFWLGFKAGNASISVWVADPWDADYLGVAASELVRESEILEAHGILQLDSSRQFGSSGRELLLRARQMESVVVTVKPDKQHAEPIAEWDIFISHASEDKESFVHPLAQELTARGVCVWYDKFTLRLGDSLREKIDYGLRSSKFGLVVLSPHFFRKDWPKKELDGLVALEGERRKVVLPIWHNVTQNEVAGYSPILAGRLAVSSSTGMDNVVKEIMRALE